MYNNILSKIIRPRSHVQRLKSVAFLTLFALIVYAIILNCTQPKEIEGHHVVTQHKKLPEGYGMQYRKIDWHDWERIAEESKRIGPGEQGQPIQLVGEEEHSKSQKSFQGNGFSGFVSDKIALDRAIKDIRNPLCKGQEYLSNLPGVSIIIPFYNEHWSTLMRSVHSIVNRSPIELIIEIILVDDASTKEHCQKPVVENYLRKQFPQVQTSVIHLAERQGLIGARLAGAENAKGEVLVFLDSHIEVNVNWLPPLLEPIQEDWQTAVCPLIDVIAYDTFEYRAQDEGGRGAFDWEMYYKRLPLLPQDLENPVKPFNNPVMAGGLFAISANFFRHLGGYDKGLKIWGGEQYELSFKIWQCGGKLVDAPCSRVGHVYRKFAPFSFGGNLQKNYKRVAMVWMDEYAEYIYKKKPAYRNIDAGDISEQISLRQRLKCKPFKWFMKNIAFDLTKTYPPVEPPDLSNGYIKSQLESSLCLDSKFQATSARLGLASCSGMSSQKFHLTWHKDIRTSSKVCFDVSVGGDQAPINFYPCHGKYGNQLWKYDDESKTLRHVNSNRCIDMNPDQMNVFASTCSPGKPSQKWILQDLNLNATVEWEKIL